MKPLDLESVDGVGLEAVVHPAIGRSRHGTVVAVHGMGADMDEGGMYMRLAERLADTGLTVIRFSFRGHGGSAGHQRGVTIAGQMLDLGDVIEEAANGYPGRLSIVATGFGAVPTALSLPYLNGRLHGLVLWNPVLDLRHTFLEPEMPWGVRNFGADARQRLRLDGFLVVDGDFEVGRVLFEEMKYYRPGEPFLASRVPTLVVHGDRDTHVSYDVARAAAAGRPDCGFHTIDGSGHGFDSRDDEDEALEVTVAWLTARHAGRA